MSQARLALGARFGSEGGDRSALGRLSIVLGLAALLATALLSLALGAVNLPLGRVLELLAQALSGDMVTGGRDGVVVYDIRLPRTIMGALVGAALALSGAVMQGLFRNPLADPGLIGVSPSAALAAVFVIVLGGALAPDLSPEANAFVLPVAAFGGGLSATFLLYAIATRRGRTAIATLLLAGIALGAFAGAASGALIFVADDQQIRTFTFWSLGSLAGATWWKVAGLLPFCLAAFVAAPALARALNALSLGEAEAFHLGVRVEVMKRLSMILVAGAVGAAVAVSGTIGFIGLVVPHLLRLTIGPDHRFLLPAAALFGAALLVAADTICRIAVAPAELPIGILTAGIGAPFFLWLVLRERPMEAD